MKFSKKKANAFSNSVDFSKCNGLACAVAQSASKDVLMVAFMDKKALLLTLTTGFMHYFSRSRKRIWRKGEESGNVQQVLGVKKDCDSDALLFTVLQKGPACHTGEKTCFGKPQFDLLSLMQLIEERKKSAPTGSYTKKLLCSKKLAIAKVREEAAELIEAAQKKGKKDIAWEACDLLFHALALAGACGVPSARINRELARRTQSPKGNKCLKTSNPIY